jgi:serine phosphatase RsbU (regulator of sigma subunit)/anti-sigma regulatory factor (Ser/Thr protein kinase)
VLESACDASSVASACWQLRQFLAESGLDALELDQWEIVLIEAGNNAVQHATEVARVLPIRFELHISSNSVCACVFDHTPGFTMPSSPELPGVDSEAGRGLFLIQSLTDCARYIRGREQNCLYLQRGRGQEPVAMEMLAVHGAAQQDLLVQTQLTLDRMTEELASCYEILSAIFRFSGQLAGELKPEAFARKWLEDLLKTVQGDWYVFRVLTPDGLGLRLAAASNSADAIDELPLAQFQEKPANSECEAAIKRTDVWFGSAALIPAADVLPVRDGCGLSHPIMVNEKLLGVLTIGRKAGNSFFEAAHVNVIQLFGDFLGAQFLNEELHESQARARVAKRELEIASEIQHSFLPKELPCMPGLELATHYRSSSLVCGDFYDSFQTPDGGLFLAIADVMGKGLPAAMFATVFRAQLRAGADHAASPGAFMAWLNRMLFADLDRVQMFITARFLWVNVTERRLVTAAAGHPPLLVADTHGVHEAGQTGFPLGVFEDSSYAEQELALPDGARILLFTDGLTESEDPSGRPLGLQPLKDALHRSARLRESPRDFKSALVRLLEQFRGGTAAKDDETFLVLAGTDSKVKSHAP